MTSKEPTEVNPLDELTKLRKDEQPIGDGTLREVIESDGFYTTPRTPGHENFFYFHFYGDYLKGVLLGKISNKALKRSSSYRIKVTEMKRDGKEEHVKEGHVEEFFGNKILQRTIDKNELIGSTVRIVFVGRQKTGFGHAAKIYRVFKSKSGLEMESVSNGPKRRKRKPRAKPSPGRARRAGRNAARVPASV